MKNFDIKCSNDRTQVGFSLPNSILALLQEISSRMAVSPGRVLEALTYLHRTEMEVLAPDLGKRYISAIVDAGSKDSKPGSKTVVLRMEKGCYASLKEIAQQCGLTISRTVQMLVCLHIAEMRVV